MDLKKGIKNLISGVNKAIKRVHRLTKHEFDSVMQCKAGGAISSRDQNGQTVEPMVLRPTPWEPSYWDDYNQGTSKGDQDTYFIVH